MDYVCRIIITRKLGDANQIMVLFIYSLQFLLYLIQDNSESLLSWLIKVITKLFTKLLVEKGIDWNKSLHWLYFDIKSFKNKNF